MPHNLCVACLVRLCMQQAGLCVRHVQQQCSACAGQTSLPTAKPCGRNAKLTRQKFGRGACSLSKRSMSTSCKRQVCGLVSVSV